MHDLRGGIHSSRDVHGSIESSSKCRANWNVNKPLWQHWKYRDERHQSTPLDYVCMYAATVSAAASAAYWMQSRPRLTLTSAIGLLTRHAAVTRLNVMRKNGTQKACRRMCKCNADGNRQEELNSVCFSWTSRAKGILLKTAAITVPAYITQEMYILHFQRCILTFGWKR